MTDEYVIQVKPAKQNKNYNYKSRQSFNKLTMYIGIWWIYFLLISTFKIRLKRNKLFIGLVCL